MRLVGYYASSGEGLRHYVDVVNRMSRERGWQLGDPLWPHDGRNREWGSGKSRMEMFHEYTGRYPRIVPTLSVDDGIAAVRATLPHCEFDAGPCADGLKALKAYRKDWDEERGTWKDRPRHDWASHGADAFRVLATRLRYIEPPPPPKPKPTDKAILIANPDGSVTYEPGFSIWEWAERRRRGRERDL
jgi:phage terminase large subunit